MLPPDPHGVMKQSTTFRELHLGTNNIFLMARLLNIWTECDPCETTSATSIQMLWLDKEGQLMEAVVRCGNSPDMCSDMNLGCLYTMINPTVIPAKSERRIAPSSLRLCFTNRGAFEGIHEYRSTMNFPDDYAHQVLCDYSISPASLPLCYSEITGCVTHITEPLRVNSDTFMFQIYLEDMSGNKGLVSYIGTRIKQFIHSADGSEVHYPLIITATGLTRNVHEFTHIPPFCFVTSPGTRLIVQPYNETTHLLMNRFFHNRLPVDIIDYSSKERLGYLRRKIPPRISLLELKTKVPLGEMETEILYRCKLKILKFHLGSETCKTFPGDTELYYELQAECESGNHTAKIVLNHQPALALIRMPPLEFQMMPYDERVELLKTFCNVQLMAELYIVGSEDSDEPHIRMFAIWDSKAFRPLLELKLRI